jgi:hypothetical protein
VDVLLGKAELLEGDTSSDLDLSSDDVDTGDLLCEVRSVPENARRTYR